MIGHNSPTIQTLSIEPAQIDAGQTATLKWSVDHAERGMSIDPGLGPVQTEDTFPVSPRGTTTYTLTAKKGSNVVTKSVTLQACDLAQLPPARHSGPNSGPAPVPVPAPGPGQAPRPVPAPVAGPPVITSFSATPAVVQAGQTVVLQWSTRNARSVSFPGANPPQKQSASSRKSQYYPSAPPGPSQFR